MKLIHAYNWTPEDGTHCVVFRRESRDPLLDDRRFVKWGLTTTGVKPVMSESPQWLPLTEAALLAKEFGYGNSAEVAEKYDIYRMEQERRLSWAKDKERLENAPALVTEPAAADDYW